MTEPTQKPEYDPENDDPVDFDMDFEEALERAAGTDPDAANDIERASVSQETTENLLDGFEDAGYDNGSDEKCWYARDVQRLLG